MLVVGLLFHQHKGPAIESCPKPEKSFFNHGVSELTEGCYPPNSKAS